MNNNNIVHGINVLKIELYIENNNTGILNGETLIEINVTLFLIFLNCFSTIIYDEVRNFVLHIRDF